MSQENTQEPQVATETTQEQAQVDTGGLPSAVKKLDTSFSEDQIKDGLIGGRWLNTTEMLKSYRELENAYSQGKNQEKQAERTIESATKQKEAMLALMPQFIANGYALDSEMTKIALENGIDEKDLRLGAYEIKEQLTLAHSVTGGSEQYDKMIEWAKATLPEAEVQLFNTEVSKGVKGAGIWAIRGLYAQYSNGNTANTGEPQRLGGSVPVHRGVQPYTTKEELMRDVKYVNSPKGKRDIGANNAYRARLAVTDQSIYKRT